MFYSSISSTNDKLSKKEKNINVYNLSSHGAYFENSIPIKRGNQYSRFIKILILMILIFLPFLIKHSIKELSEESKKEIKNEITFLENDSFKTTKRNF